MRLSSIVVAIAISGIVIALIVVFGYLTAVGVPTDGLAAFASAIVIPILAMLINHVKTIEINNRTAQIADDVQELKENVANGGDATSPPFPEGHKGADKHDH